MARAKKSEEKVKEKEGATLSIDVDSFVRTRDSVVTGLATLQDAIQTLSSAYIKHTNAVLGEHGAGLDVDSALAKLGENPLLKLGDMNGPANPVTFAPAAPAAPAEPATESKKERKKRLHDPNAPKRPLTPFFLYMQTARSIIAEDLGDAPKGAVSSEGTRRWGVMDEISKQAWTDVYRENLRLYNARVHSYKSGNILAKEMTDEEAGAYAEENDIAVPATSGETADAQLVGESSAAAHHEDEDADAEGEPETIEKDPTPPPKTPKARAPRKSRAKVVEAVPSPVAEPVVPSSAASAPPKAEPELAKKRKRASKGKVADEAEEGEKEELAVETPKTAPKSRKKKAKTDS